MWALTVAGIYFGTFIALGYLARLALTRLTTVAELSEVQAQAGPNRGPRRLFLLGAWRTER
jgi:hypothetical protein